MKAHPRSVRGEHAIQHERVKMRVEQAARPMRQAQDPLSDRRVGEDLIDEMRRPPRHAPVAAARAEPPPLHEKATSRAVCRRHTESGQNHRQGAAPQKVANLLVDKPRKSLAAPQRHGVRTEGLEIG